MKRGRARGALPAVPLRQRARGALRRARPGRQAPAASARPVGREFGAQHRGSRRRAAGCVRGPRNGGGARRGRGGAPASGGARGQRSARSARRAPGPRARRQRLGVGARRSAAKSMSVVSVSWPTAEMSGIALAAAARTTISSLKGHKSSIEPPPRATMRTSGRGTAPPGAKRLKPAIAAATSPAARSPWTTTGHRSTRRWETGRRGGAGCRG